MFKIGNRESYPWPVKVSQAKGAGEFETFEFGVRFKRLDQVKINDMIEQSVSGKLSDIDFARDVVCGFDGVAGNDGEPLVYSSDALDLLLMEQGVARAIVSAYFDSTRGGKEKN